MLETSFEMERFDKRADEKDPGATMVVLDLGKTLERVSLPVVGLGDAFRFSQKTLACAMPSLRTPAVRSVHSHEGASASETEGFR